MGQFFDEIPERMIPWIKKQKMFWVASAPLSSDGHVNVSPKGVDGTFHIVDSHRVWYDDLTGSGIETISHLRENGRITLLFIALDGPARILRMFGTGTVYEFGTPEYNGLVTPDLRTPGSRAAIVIDVHKVGTSCGWGVPLYEYKADRTKMVKVWSEAEAKDCVQDEAALRDNAVELDALPRKGSVKSYWKLEGLNSIDGLPGLLSAYLSPQPPVFRTVVTKSPLDLINNQPAATNQLAHARSASHVKVVDFKTFLAFLYGILFTILFTQTGVYRSALQTYNLYADKLGSTY